MSGATTQEAKSWGKVKDESDIANILMKTGLKPEHLRVELTERALLENTDIVLANMKALKPRKN